MSVNRRLKIAVIGVGGRGHIADSYLSGADNVEICAGADISAEMLAAFKSRVLEKQGFEPRCYYDYQEMVNREEPDGVFITSPDFCHEEQAIFSLQKNVGVYLEKPVGISVDGADRVLRAAYAHKTKLMLGHNMRYMTFVLKMKELIDAGAIGEVKTIWCRHFVGYGGDAYFRDWHAERKNTNSLLLQKGAHDIDVIHWLAGAYTVRVNGMGNLSVYDKLPRRGQAGRAEFSVDNWPPLEQTGFNPVIDVEDLNIINMQLANGVLATYMQCHYTPDTCRNYTIIGTKGRIENYGDHFDNTTIELWDDRKIDSFRLHGDATFRTPPSKGGHGGSDPAIVRSFFAMLRDGTAPNSSPQAARYSVATGCMGAASIRSGGMPMNVPPLAEELENYDYHK
ncbi:MAG: Gfo/Idh/MocA family oxidoreductase [Bacillota bacterium]